MNPAELRETLKPTIWTYPHPEAALIPSCPTLCFGTVCYLRGAKDIYDQLRLHLSSDGDPIEEVATSSCLGHCYAAPVFRMNNGMLHKAVFTCKED